ncbi:hypothetical protein [Amycolatopsis nigrescens]|uniref:hypothetical protein n=1 Tax=Amycolatopsis nigrescens TaxID=381445 RepID=UPI00036063CD|nr:hypothetical protein [Amycolatopsis nigrescens]
MNIIEEQRTELRVGAHTFRIAVAALRGEEHEDGTARISVQVGAAGPEGEPVADGRLEVDTAAAAMLGTVLSEVLRQHSVLSEPGRRRPPRRAARQGQPWTEEMDAELERRWLAGEGVPEVAEHFERTPGAIRSRLPRVGCDPERPGHYLPEPPSRRAAEEVSAVLEGD